MNEIWKNHKDIDANYEFSNFGNFRRVGSDKNLKPTICDSNVITFLKSSNGQRKRVRVCRVIADLFVPNPTNEKLIIHNDGDNLNNHYLNLRWGSSRETVQIAFKKQTRKSSFIVIKDADAISIRKEYDETNITTGELAKKYNTSQDNIVSIVRHKTRTFIDNKSDYKFNNLEPNEMDAFLDTKRERELELVKSKNKEMKELRFRLPTSIMNKLAQEYVDTTLFLSEIAEKYGYPIEQIEYNFKDYLLPTITKLDGETFVNIEDNVQISNHGRVTIDGKLSPRKRFTINGITRGIRFLVAKHFVLNPNNYFVIKSIDGNIKNISHTNLIWVFPSEPQQVLTDSGVIQFALFNGHMVPLESIKDVIIQDYLNSTKFIDFRGKYLIGYKTLFKLLRPHIKQKRMGKHMCESCGETNEFYFYSQTTKICKHCMAKLRLEERKEITPEQTRRIAMVKRNWDTKFPIKRKLTEANIRAKKKRIDFDLDEPFILEIFEKQNGKCFYSNVPITLDKSGQIFSIDRIDSNGGYTKDNVVLTTGRINKMKSDSTKENFLKIIKEIYEHNFGVKNL